MNKFFAFNILLGTAFLGAATALLAIFAVVFLAPYIIYVTRSPSSQSECEKIHAGMKPEEVLAVIDKSTPPYDEGYTTSMIFFSRNGSTCEVQLDSRGVTVVSIRTLKRTEISE
jgi:hypothetical protein